MPFAPRSNRAAFLRRTIPQGRIRAEPGGSKPSGFGRVVMADKSKFLKRFVNRFKFQTRSRRWESCSDSVLWKLTGLWRRNLPLEFPPPFYPPQLRHLGVGAFLKSTGLKDFSIEWGWVPMTQPGKNSRRLGFRAI